MAGCLNGGRETRKNLTVAITHDGKPLAGVNIHFVSEGVERFAGATDADGIVRLASLEPGEYWINAEFLGTGAAYDCFHINNRSSLRAKRKLTYTWGDDPPATNRVAGRLIDSQPGKGGTPLWNLIHRVDVPISGARLKLHDSTTGAVYNSASDHDGVFAFEAIPDGTYVLHIEGGAAGDRTYDATDAVVKLSSGANRNWLLFRRQEAGGGSCGGTELKLQAN
jgi:hypothetical protein